MKSILVVGSGFSGSVIAHELSKKGNYKITLVDERDHLGGNCFTEKDPETGITIHKYGPHIFNTDNKNVWDFISQFCELVPFINRVKAIKGQEVFSMPINLHTINQFYRKSMDPNEAQGFIQELGDNSIQEPKNFEEQALKMIGNDLYKTFFYGYTKKQWGCEPKFLPASILKRLPVRFNYNDNYYNTTLQGIPKNGYTEIFEKMLANENIQIQLNTKFDSNYPTESFDHIFYTGPIDAFFNFKYGRLGYRTVFFEKNIANGDFQGNAVINYCDEEISYTRIHEHKHFTPWQNFEKTVYFKEFSKETTETDIPYYPKRLDEDIKKLSEYQKEISRLQNFTFLGRLATYRYMDMHHVIQEALDVASEFITSSHAK